MFVDFFIRRPIFATVCAILIVLVGAVCIPALPIAQYPQIALPQVTVHELLHGRQLRGRRVARSPPRSSRPSTACEGMKYITSVERRTTAPAPSPSPSTSTATSTSPRSTCRTASAPRQARLPNEVKQTGVTVTKNSSSFVLAVALFTEDGRYDQKFISNYADVFMQGRAEARARASPTCRSSASASSPCASGSTRTRLAARELTAVDVVNALAGAERPGRRRARSGVPPAPTGQSFQISRARPGAARRGGGVRGHRPARPSRTATLVRVQRRRARRAGRRGLLGLPALRRARRRSASASSSSRAPTRSTWPNRVEGRARAALQGLPARAHLRAAFDTTLAGERVHQGGRWSRWLEAIALVIARHLRLPPEPAGHAHPGDHHPGLARRDVRLREALRLLDQHPDALRPHAGDGARGRRRHRRHREHPAAHRREGPHRRARPPRRADARSPARSSPPRWCSSRCSCRSPSSRHHRPHLPAVLADHRLLGRALDVQLAHPHAGALGALLLRGHAEHKNVFFRGVDRVLDALRRGYGAVLARLLRCAHRAASPWRSRPASPARPSSSEGAHRLRARGGPGLLHRHRRRGPRAARSAYTEGVVAEVEAVLEKQPEILGTFSVGGFSFGGSGPEQGHPLRQPEAVGRAARRRARRGGDRRSPARPARGHHRGHGPPLLAARRSRASATSAASSSSSKTSPARASSTTSPRRPSAIMSEGNKSPALRGVFSTFTANDPQLVVDLDRAEDQGPRGPRERRLLDAPGLRGLGLRERLRLQQPHLPRLRAGRPGTSAPARGPVPLLRPLGDGRPWCRSAEPRQGSTRTTTALDHQPLQPLPLHGDQRLAAPRA